jgi:hypothetical protein
MGGLKGAKLGFVQMPSALKSALRDAVNTVFGVAPSMLTVTCPSNWLRPTFLAVGETAIFPLPWPLIAVKLWCVEGSARAKPTTVAGNSAAIPAANNNLGTLLSPRLLK